VPATWYKLALELVRHTPGYAPPVASRAFAYLGVTLHEAVAPGLPRARSLAGQLEGLGRLPQPETGRIYAWPAVAHAALAHMAAHLFANTGPSGQNALRTVGSRLGRSVAEGLTADVLERSTRYGEAVAEAIQVWAVTDGGADGSALAVTFSEGYVLPTGAASWVSTSRTYPSPLLPYWGRNRPSPWGRRRVPARAPRPTRRRRTPAFTPRRSRSTARSGTSPRSSARSPTSGRTTPCSPPPRRATGSPSWAGCSRSGGPGWASPPRPTPASGSRSADAFIGCWHAKYEFNLLRR
jgi:hypothetical protein